MQALYNQDTNYFCGSAQRPRVTSVGGACNGRVTHASDRGGEYCGKMETHDYQLYLAINDMEHTRTKAYPPARLKK